MSWRLISIMMAAAVGLVIVGAVGAWAFNPDSGELGRTVSVWRLAGIGVYVGTATQFLLMLIAVVKLGVEFHQRRHPH